MITSIIIVNVFLCPMLAVMLYYKRADKGMKLDAYFLCRYSIFVACNMLITKAMVVGVHAIGKVLISLDSTYYTLLALISAGIMPYLYEIIKKNVKVRCIIEKNDEEKNER